MKLRLVSALAVVLILSASTAFGATSIAVVGAAALEGSFGMRVTFSGGGDAYVQDNSPNNEGAYFASFKMRDDALTLQNFDQFQVLRATGAEDGSNLVFQVKIINTIPNVGGTDYAIWVVPRLDDGSFGTRIATFVKPGTHTYTAEFHKSSAPGANDGSCKIYRDSVLKMQNNTYDNDTKTVNAVRFGAIGVSATATGVLDLDSFVSTRTPQF
ncbi:MAG: hypothetical protein U0X73_07470 [Thermoanaerobaculia bacterium]